MHKKSLLSVLLITLFPLLASAQSRFDFRDGKFVVAQFTDLHWMPASEKCAETAATIRAVLAAEHPDLAVLSGDVVTYDPAMEGWKKIVSIFEEAETPFVVTMGNHDAEYLTKDEMYDFLLKSPCYAGARGPADIMGCGNCIIPIYGSAAEGKKVEALLYCIDSNDYQPDKRYGAYDWIHFNQVEWYRRQSAGFTEANGGKPLPALAFFHIPLPEYKEVIGDGKTYGSAKEGIAGSAVNSGMFASFIEAQDVMGVFVGHDHDNDFIGINKGIALGFGRVTGADAYGSLKRGARIIELYEGKRKFDTWIATPAGREATYYYPSGLNSEEEQQMTYEPALKTSAKKQGVAYTYYEGKCKRVADIASCAKLKEGTMKNISIKEAPVTDHFAYDFRTLVNIPEKGIYRFYTFSDDGSVLYIDGKLVVDNDGGHSGRRAEGKIALEKGLHQLHLLYFEDYMGQELEVGFSGRNISDTPLTDEMLFLPE